MSAISLPVISKFDPTGIRKAQGALKGFGSQVAKLGGIVAGAFSVAAVTNFAKESVSAASDLQESLNAVAVSFGDASAAVIKLGEDASSRLGVTQTAFNQAAVRFSAFADRIVGEGGNTAGFIDDITTRAADFASVFNIDVSEALQVFQSGLAGEAEPLKRFGINLLQTEVEAYALRSGIISVGETMTEQQKVQARYGLLLETTAKTAGDFANTSDGLANSQRILQATFKDMQAEVGNALLPAFASLSKELVPLVQKLAPKLTDVFEDLAPVIEDIVDLLPDLLDEFTPILPVLGDLIELFGDLIRQILPPVIRLIKMLVPVVAALVPPIVELIRVGLEVMIRILDDLIVAFRPLLDAVLPLFSDLLDELAPLTIQLINAFMPLIQMVVPMLTSLLRYLIPVMSQVASIMSSQLIGTVRVLFNVLSQAGGFLTNFTNAFRNAFVAVSSFIRNSVNGMIGLVEGFINNAIRGLNFLIGRLNRIRFSLPSWVPFIGGRSFGINIPYASYTSLPRLAEGGLVTGPTIAMIGEAGPEAVIPLDKSGLMGTTINVTVNAGMGTNGAEVGRQVVNAIKDYERRNGKVFVAA